MAVIRIVRINAPFTFRVYRRMATSSPSSVSDAAAVFGNTNSVGVPPLNVPSGNGVAMSPPLTKPMKRMNNPMPTAIASLRLFGTAFITASRRPARTSTVTTMPSRTITPIAPCGVSPSPTTNWNATAALIPNPVAIATG